MYKFYINKSIKYKKTIITAKSISKYSKEHLKLSKETFR